MLADEVQRTEGSLRRGSLQDDAANKVEVLRKRKRYGGED